MHSRAVIVDGGRNRKTGQRSIASWSLLESHTGQLVMCPCILGSSRLVISLLILLSGLSIGLLRPPRFVAGTTLGGTLRRQNVFSSVAMEFGSEVGMCIGESSSIPPGPGRLYSKTCESRTVERNWSGSGLQHPILQMSFE